MRSLTQLRKKIDALDAQLVDILSRRAELVSAVADWKRQNQKQVYDPSREQFILDRVAQLNPGPLSAIEIQEMMALLIRGFRNFEERVNSQVLVQKNNVKKVSIIGMGLIGGSIALSLARRPDLYQLMGFDVSAPKKTRVGRVIQEWARSPQEALQADVVILALPVTEIVRFLKKYRKNFRPGSIVTDVGSTKREICATAWQVLDPSVVFIGGHPLAGKAQSGAEVAEADLFAGKPFVLVPGRNSDGIDELEKILSILGAGCWFCDAETHDQLLAFTSHLPQMTSIALTLAVAQAIQTQGPVLHGPALREMTRLAESDPRMWQDIVKTNGDHLEDAMDDLISELKKLKQTLKRGNLTQKFKAAKKARTAMIRPN